MRKAGALEKRHFLKFGIETEKETAISTSESGGPIEKLEENIEQNPEEKKEEKIEETNEEENNERVN